MGAAQRHESKNRTTQERATRRYLNSWPRDFQLDTGRKRGQVPVFGVRRQAPVRQRGSVSP